MKTRRLFFIVLALLLLVPHKISADDGVRFDGVHRIGGGMHYWKSLEDIIIEGVDEEGLALIFSYQYQILRFFTLEANLEFLSDGYAGADGAVFAPQLYALIGRGLYAGGGIGLHITGKEIADSPFLALRAGLDIELLPSIFLDINANYRSETWGFGKINEDIQLNTLTLGAILRLEF